MTTYKSLSWDATLWLYVLVSSHCHMANQVIGVAVILQPLQMSVSNIILPKKEPLGLKHCKKFDEV